MASDWPLLTGGRYSEVVVRTGLTVIIFKYKKIKTVYFINFILKF